MILQSRRCWRRRRAGSGLLSPLQLWLRTSSRPVRPGVGLFSRPVRPVACPYARQKLPEAALLAAAVPTVAAGAIQARESLHCGAPLSALPLREGSNGARPLAGQRAPTSPRGPSERVLRSVNIPSLDQFQERFAATFDFVGRRANLGSGCRHCSGCRRSCVFKRRWCWCVVVRVRIQVIHIE